MRMVWVIILFLISSTVAQTSITFGGYLEDLGHFLTTSHTTDTNTFLVGVIAGGLVLLQAPLIVIYKIIAEVISIVALSLFINFLGERMGFGSFIPFFRDALPRDDLSISDLSISESPFDHLPDNDNIEVRSYVDKKYLVSVYPEGQEIKTVRIFHDAQKGAESEEFVDRRSHRKMHSRRRNNLSSGRSGRNKENSNIFPHTYYLEIPKSYLAPPNSNIPTPNNYFPPPNSNFPPPNSNYNTKTRNLSNENSHYFYATYNRTNPSNGRNSFTNKRQNSIKSENKGILNYISDLGNDFIKTNVNNFVNKVLESDGAKSLKNYFFEIRNRELK